MKSDNEIHSTQSSNLNNLCALQVQVDHHFNTQVDQSYLINLRTQGLGLKTKYYQNTLRKTTHEI